MNSYLERKTQQQTISKSLNPMAKEYEPPSGNALRHRNESTLTQNDPSSMDAHPKEKNKQLTIKPSQEAHVNTGYQYRPNVHETAQHALSFPYAQPSLDFIQPMQLQLKEEPFGGIYHNAETE